MIDGDVLILALVNMAGGVKTLIGDKGAKAVMRDAGRQAGPKLLESLIGHFPEVLPKEEAIKRSCVILENLGFAQSIKVGGSKIDILEDAFTDAIEDEDLFNSPIVYFLAGLIEGFVSFMSNEKVILIPQDVQKGKIVYNFS